MAIRKRTTKTVAKRHDLDYFKKGSPIRLWQWRLALVALVCALVWLGASSRRSASAFSAGPISNSHAVFGQRCEVCHVPVVRGAGWLPVIGDRRHVPDAACQSCHQAGPHHANLATSRQSCGSCHLEHTGSMHLAAAPDSTCTVCHANLQVRSGALPAVARNIRGFTAGHPDFRPLRTATPEVKSAAFGLKFNHSDHLQPGLRGPEGNVTLSCASCHKVEEERAGFSRGDGLMAPVKFERDCQSCHTLDFDGRIAEQAPHGEAVAALRFVEMKLNAAHADRASMVKAEALLFRGKCSLCHETMGAQQLPNLTLAALAEPTEVPHIAPSRQPERWLTDAVFSHSAHGAVQCTECHAAALASTSGSDLLLPGIGVCQRCHDGQSRPQGPVLQAGHAESGCFLCHNYHEGHTSGTIAHGAQAFRVDELLRR